MTRGQILLIVICIAVALVGDMTWASYRPFWPSWDETYPLADRAFWAWAIAHPRPPWYIWQFSPWRDLSPVSAGLTAFYWGEYFNTAWIAPAAGALVGAVIGRVGFLRPAARRATHAPAAAPVTARAVPPPPVCPPDSPAQPEPRPVVSAPCGALRQLRAAVEKINGDAILAGDLDLRLIARNPALGEHTSALDETDFKILALALRLSGRWETVRRRRAGTKVQLWRRRPAPRPNEDPDHA